MKRRTPKRSVSGTIIFLFDLDNTLLDNDRVTANLSEYLKRQAGPDRKRRDAILVGS
jgi:FMN phosphatase YigB (HAD superfamily)